MCLPLEVPGLVLAGAIALGLVFWAVTSPKPPKHPHCKACGHAL